MSTLLPAPATGPESAAPPPRLVPASIGRPGRVQVVHVACEPWCVIDHVAERVVAVEDISHRGAPDHAQVPTMTDDLYSAFEIYSQLYSDPAADDPRMRVAAVVVTDGSRDAYLTPDMADEAADELIAFAMGVKEKARVARLANLAAA
ncbi:MULTISPECIES: DUF6907 domain-containing protein [unclassified Streptomyces]|uniref:DUF6907 domain-containing protein n=1 Tax=unclassified Streptomyces TaxID=2593676 RepID=UPI002E281861|nr:hypothetical protein [Streptomyces sp. NBC_00228]